MDALQVAGIQRSKVRAFLDFRLPDRSFGEWKRRKTMSENHHRLSFAVLASTCALLAMPPSYAHAIDVGVSVNAGNAVSADVGTSLGGGRGVSADANASVGGSNGVNADATANAGGGQGIDADVNAGVGNGLDVSANARIGGGRGVNADLNARAGGSDGADANATASIGGGSGVDANLAVGRVGGVDGAGAASGGDGSVPGGGLSPSQVRTLEAFRARPVNEQRKMLVRCADISASSGSASGGSDSGLVGLCSLLQATASR
ncbi:hypothetical protein EEQ99_31815 [Rhizobium anhuiense]|uniref:Uncharacterized protein n=2 Tax=Rhizobium anhuiense TaxID=1184720 RepID=A0A432N9U4_9HYPH|nr:hypothetical protein EEQ99_31815 [Rhizobium anhuiense]